jgi:uncharacterized protein
MQFQKRSRLVRSAVRYGWALGFFVGSLPLSPASAQTLPEKISFAINDINAMWEKRFRTAGKRWVPPKTYIYTGPVKTACGLIGNGNALYCPPSNEVYLNQPFLTGVNRRIGDFAAITVLAHEYGHAVQKHYGLTRFASTVLEELQADCFAGVYAHDAHQRGLLDETDIPEAKLQSYLSGDRVARGSRAVYWNSHGSPKQRLTAFQMGYQRGFEACLTYSS